MNDERANTALILLISLLAAVLIGGGAYGWVMNIVKLVGLVDATLTGIAILRVVGVFLFPLGAVLGFC